MASPSPTPSSPSPSPSPSPPPEPCPPGAQQLAIDSVTLVGGPVYCSGNTVQAVVQLKGDCCGARLYTGSRTVTITLPNNVAVHTNEPFTVDPCNNGTGLSGTAPSYTVAAVDKIVVEDGVYTNEGPVTICLGGAVKLRALRLPSPPLGGY